MFFDKPLVNLVTLWTESYLYAMCAYLPRMLSLLPLFENYPSIAVLKNTPLQTIGSCPTSGNMTMMVLPRWSLWVRQGALREVPDLTHLELQVHPQAVREDDPGVSGNISSSLKWWHKNLTSTLSVNLRSYFVKLRWCLWLVLMMKLFAIVN